MNCRKCEGLNEPKNTMASGGFGNPTSNIVFIGQSLHSYNSETDPQIPFIGPVWRFDTGNILFHAIIRSGFRPFAHTFITNVVHCHCPKNRPSFAHEENNCWPFLYEELSHINPSAVIVLGHVTSKAIQRQLTEIKIPGRKIEWSFLYHPGYFLRRGMIGKEWSIWCSCIRHVLRRHGKPEIELKNIYDRKIIKLDREVK